MGWGEKVTREGVFFAEVEGTCKRNPCIPSFLDLDESGVFLFVGVEACCLSFEAVLDKGSAGEL